MLLPLVCLHGCSRPGIEPVQLTLISPHRDEIREEAALAFKDWFRSRAEAHLHDAQQALQIAGTLEPDAAAHAKKVISEYVLLNYAQKNSTQPDMTNRPAWMIYYQQIPLQSTDPAVDPTPFPQSHHDLYVFLDATSGKELLAVWV